MNNNKNKDYQYLDEDRDIMEELELSTNRMKDKETLKVVLSALQIKSTLRNRKTMVDLDKSNKNFSTAILFIAYIQSILMGFQLILQFIDSSNRNFAMILSAIFFGFIFWVVRNLGKLNKE